jgi:drug/metabolite transporter (DMT)-like permease
VSHSTEPVSVAPIPPGTPLPRLGWLLLAAIALFWGANWSAIKVALVDIPIWQYRAITCGFAGTALLSLAAVSGQSLRVPRAAWGALLLAALLNVTGWQILTAYGVRLIASGEAAVIGFTMPIWVTLLGALFLKEPVTPRVLVALALTVGGILDLLWPALGALNAAPLGMLLMIGSALSWACGTIVQKRVRWPLPPLAVTGWQLVLGAAPIALVAISTERFALPHASALALWAMAYSCVLSMTVGQYAWFKIVSIFPATIASIGTVAVPVVAAILGALLLGEPLGWREFVALLCVTSAIALVLFQPARATPRRS